MKLFKLLSILSFLVVLSNCQNTLEALSGKKKEGADAFLVKKKIH